MLVNFISLLVSYFAGRATSGKHGSDSNGGFLTGFTLSAVKKAFTVAALYLSFVVVMIFGAVIITCDLIMTTKQLNVLALSDLSWVGLGVIAFGVVAMAILSWMDFRGESLTFRAAKETKQPHHALSEAVTLLILDFIEERRSKRAASTMESDPSYGSDYASSYRAQQTSNHN